MNENNYCGVCYYCQLIIYVIEVKIIKLDELLTLYGDQYFLCYFI